MRKKLALCCLAVLFSEPVRAQVLSAFDSGDEGWQVIDLPWPSGPYDPITGGPFTPTFSGSSGNPGGGIASTDRPGVPVSYFQAPSAFLGNQAALYGGNLSFDVKPFIGNVSFSQPDVVLVGGGIVLTADAGPQPNFDLWNSYTLTLSETGGWQKSGGGTPTAGEFQSVLANVTALRIRAEYSDAAGSVMDNVAAVPEPQVTAMVASVTLLWFGFVRRKLHSGV